MQLYRSYLYQQLARIARKHKKLDYPRFCIQAFTEMNPDFTSDPDDNFSILESIRGFLSPKPIGSTFRNQSDLRFYIDSVGRPDLYAIRCLDRQRSRWNQGIEGSTLRLKRVYYPVTIPHPAKKGIPAWSETVLYDYLRIARGKEDVNQINIHAQNTINGLNDSIDDINANCLNVRNIDKEIQRVLQENRNIENGRNP